MTPTRDTAHPSVRHLLAGHFREARGYDNWRVRGTDSWLLIYTIDGAGRFGGAGGEFRTQPGDMILIRPGIRHDYGTEAQTGVWDLLWAHFYPRSHWLEWLSWPEVQPGLLHLALREPVIRQKIVARFLETHRLATGALKLRESFAMNALEEVLLWCGTQNPRSEQGRIDARIHACTDYLGDHLAEKMTLDDLARIADLSVSRMAHLFREQVGQTPQQYLESQRLARARQFLELSGKSIQEIAAEVGFDNPFYFTVRFKRLTGLSPRDYRRRLSGESPEE